MRHVRCRRPRQGGRSGERACARDSRSTGPPCARVTALVSRLRVRAGKRVKHEMPLLQRGRHPGDRLARERGGRLHPPSPALPGLQQALHDLRDGGAAHAADREDQRRARGLLEPEAAHRFPARAAQAARHHGAGRCRHHPHRAEDALAGRARDRLAPPGRAGDGGIAPPRQGRLHSLRFRLQELLRRRGLPRRDPRGEGTPPK